MYFGDTIFFKQFLNAFMDVKLNSVNTENIRGLKADKIIIDDVIIGKEKEVVVEPLPDELFKI